MPLRRPQKTLGGGVWWNEVQRNNWFVLQCHKQPSLWWDDPYRIVINDTWNLVASATDESIIFKDWAAVNELIWTEQARAQRELTMDEILAYFVRLNQEAERVHQEEQQKLKQKSNHSSEDGMNGHSRPLTASTEGTTALNTSFFLLPLSSSSDGIATIPGHQGNNSGRKHHPNTVKSESASSNGRLMMRSTSPPVLNSPPSAEKQAKREEEAQEQQFEAMSSLLVEGDQVENEEQSSGVSKETTVLMPRDGQLPQHFFVLVHGNHGHASDFSETERYLRMSTLFGEGNSIILRSASNEHNKTHDGISLLGRRLALEVIEVLEKIPKNHKPYMTIIGHSLGGLILRNAIGLLDSLGYLDRVIPSSLITLSSPHLGSRRVHSFTGMWRNVIHFYVATMGETGKQLILEDDPASPLLLRMSEPDSAYMIALKKFRFRTLVGCTHLDPLVPFPSASIRVRNPYPLPAWGLPNVLTVEGFEGFNEEQLAILDKYKNSTSFLSADATSVSSDPADGQATEKGMRCDNFRAVEFPPQLVKNLNQVEWRRLDVQFGGGTAGLHFHEQVLKTKKHWKAPLLNEKAAKTFIELLVSLIEVDHMTLLREKAEADVVAFEVSTEEGRVDQERAQLKIGMEKEIKQQSSKNFVPPPKGSQFLAFPSISQLP